MVLVDTSVWADHFRTGEPGLIALLGEESVVMHPFVIGELALGNLRDWAATVASLNELPQLPIVPMDVYLSAIREARLVAAGIGFVDAHLLISARRAQDLRLWTRDKRLAAKAEAFGLRWTEPSG